MIPQVVAIHSHDCANGRYAPSRGLPGVRGLGRKSGTDDGFFVRLIECGCSPNLVANRAERQLLVHSLLFEPTFQDWHAIEPALVEALNKFTRFQQCDEWKISRMEPKMIHLSRDRG